MIPCSLLYCYVPNGIRHSHPFCPMSATVLCLFRGCLYDPRRTYLSSPHVHARVLHNSLFIVVCNTPTVDCCILTTYSHAPFSISAICHHIFHIFQSVDCCVLYCNPPIIHPPLPPPASLIKQKHTHSLNLQPKHILYIIDVMCWFDIVILVSWLLLSHTFVAPYKPIFHTHRELFIANIW